MNKLSSARYEIIHADVLDWAANYDGPKFHALLADPPWHLKGGFMGRYWDHDGPDAISFRAETWATLADILHPGAFLFIFAGSRGWHRLACAMEDANLILQPSIFVWGLGVVEVPLLYGWLQSQSFPKASRLDKKLDERAGKLEERQILGPSPHHSQGRKVEWGNGQIYSTQEAKGKWLVEPATPLARAWEGHRYGGQVLKDALTPIIVAQKPWEEPRLDCIVRTGAGAINVDAGRIGVNASELVEQSGELVNTNCHDGYKRPNRSMFDTDKPKERGGPSNPSGRWPSNFALIHRAPSPDGEGGCVRVGTRRVKAEPRRKSPKRHNRSNEAEGNEHIAYGKFGDCVTTGYADPDGYERVDAWRCAEGCPAQKLGEMSGQTSITGNRSSKSQQAKVGATNWFVDNHQSKEYPNDKGTAARFYHQAGWEHERAEMRCARDPETGEPLCPVAKLDEQAGENKSSTNPDRFRGMKKFTGEHYASDDYSLEMERGKVAIYGDEGGRSRYFHQSDWSHEIAERLATSDPVCYCPKAAKSERSKGLDDFYWRKDKQSPTGFVRVTREEWEALGEEEKRVKEETGKRVSLRAWGNVHVALKPIALCKWLASLLAPPKEYAPRRIVIPFCGTFSEGLGAMLSGHWEEVVGIDFIQDYVDIAEARAAFWAGQPRQLKLED